MPRRLIMIVLLAICLLTIACTAPATATAEEPLRDTGFDRTRPLTAGFLIVDGVYNSELMAPYDLFHHTPFHTEPEPGIEVFTVSPDGQPIVTFEGLTITPHHSFASAPAIDILVIPSSEGSMDRDLQNQELIDWVRQNGARARYLVSLCDGAFVLAEADLLDGLEATTFPGDQDRFEEAFPEVQLVRKVSFVHDGKALTSEGGARSYDVAMYLIDHLFGEKVTQGVGRGLIIPWPADPVLVPRRIVTRP